jgi:hypothetical protein
MNMNSTDTDTTEGNIVTGVSRSFFKKDESGTEEVSMVRKLFLAAAGDCCLVSAREGEHDMTLVTRLVVGLALAALSVSAAVFPASAQVNINIGIGASAPPAALAEPPAYYYGEHYYRYDNGTWFEGARHDGPWGPVGVERVPRQVQALPRAYARMPPDHVKKVGPHPWAGREKDRGRNEREGKDRGRAQKGRGRE